MKKTKKLLSILLMLVMFIGVIGAPMSCYAYNINVSNYEFVDYNQTHSSSADLDDYYTDGYKCHIFQFSVPAKGKVKFTMTSKNSNYLNNYEWLRIFSADDLYAYNHIYNCKEHSNMSYNSDNREYKSTYTMQLPAGVYYIYYDYYLNDIVKTQQTYSVYLSYSPTVTAPSNFRVTSRSTSGLKLSWNKATGVKGYQLQKKSGNTYNTLTTTTSTSYIDKNLRSTTNYTYRVRAYKTVNGKKYYSSWKVLSTATKPTKVSIKTPATNSRHQIIVKWNKITGASGYQVQYCNNKSCSSVITTKTVSGQSTVSYTGNNFTKGKTYYVRVRAYKSVNGTKYYGEWSSVKTIKCK